MKTYTIYHVPGIKIGCSVEPDARIVKQGFNSYEVLEEHTDIYEASQRELELQKEYGYTVDKIPYYKSVSNRRKGFKDPSAAGKLGYVAANLSQYHKANGLLLQRKYKCPHCEMETTKANMGRHIKARH